MSSMTDGKKKAAAALLLFAAVAASYHNALSNQFVYDDVGLVELNSLIKGWHNLPEIFTTGYWTALGGNSTGGLYRPLAMVSFLVDYSVAGLDPLAYHLDNVLLHFITSVLVYLFLRAVTGRERVSLMAALLFAVHPVHTEAVAWVSGRAELLGVLLLLLSAYVFVRGQGRPGHVYLSAFVYLLALLAKETAAVLPALLAVYMLLYHPLPTPTGNLRRLAGRLWPFALGLAVYGGLRLAALSDTALPPEGEAPLHALALSDRFLTMCTAFFQYVKLSFVPSTLNVDYYFYTRSIFEFRALAFMVMLVALAAFSRRLVRRSRDASFAVAWFFIGLIPVSNVMLVGIIMSERALYLPSVGPCLILGMGFAGLADAFSGRGAVARRAPAALFVLVIALFVALSLIRNPFWHDQDAFEKAQMEYLRKRTEVMPDYAYNYSVLVNLRIKHGMFDDETERLLAEVARLDPDDYGVHFAYACLHEHYGRLDDAISEYEICLSLFKYHDLYNRIGMLQYRLGRLDESGRSLEEAIRLNPYREVYYVNLGILRMAQGDRAAAYGLFERATRLDPANFDAYLQMGIILGSQSRFGPAVEMLRRASSIDPDNPAAHYYLAAAYAGGGNIQAAYAEVHAALKLDPEYAEARELLARLNDRR